MYAIRVLYTRQINNLAILHFSQVWYYTVIASYGNRIVGLSVVFV